MPFPLYFVPPRGLEPLTFWSVARRSYSTELRGLGDLRRGPTPGLGCGNDTRGSCLEVVTIHSPPGFSRLLYHLSYRDRPCLVLQNQVNLRYILVDQGLGYPLPSN